MRFAADGNVDHLTRVKLYSAGCHAFKKCICFFSNVLVIIFIEVDPRTMIVAHFIVANGTCARFVSMGIVM